MTNQQRMIALAMEKAIAAMQARNWDSGQETREVMHDLQAARDLVRTGEGTN